MDNTQLMSVIESIPQSAYEKTRAIADRIKACDNSLEKCKEIMFSEFKEGDHVLWRRCPYMCKWQHATVCYGDADLKDYRYSDGLVFKLDPISNSKFYSNWCETCVVGVGAGSGEFAFSLEKLKETGIKVDVTLLAVKTHYPKPECGLTHHAHDDLEVQIIKYSWLEESVALDLKKPIFPCPESNQGATGGPVKRVQHVTTTPQGTNLKVITNKKD